MGLPNHIVDNFRLRLTQTIAWCVSRSVSDDPEKSLRSLELEPSGTMNDWPALVESVCMRREQWAARAGKELLHPTIQSGGHLLVFDPGQTFSDAAALVQSGGFFDADNVPPWDTWVAYIQERQQREHSWTRLDSFLLCWIPPAFIELVQRSIAVNPEQCIQWATSLDSPFLRRLRAAKLLI